MRAQKSPFCLNYRRGGRKKKRRRGGRELCQNTSFKETITVLENKNGMRGPLWAKILVTVALKMELNHSRASAPE